MKTLDEVIYAYERCRSEDVMAGCGVCAYHDVPHCGCKCERNDDALHYLYELKLFRQTPIMQGIHKMQKDFALYPVGDWGEDEPDFNPPLSWDELKSMTGKPVWVEYNLHLSDKDARSRSRMWIIVQKIMPWRQDDELIYYSGFVFSKKEIGKTWKAYRKERGCSLSTK